MKNEEIRRFAKKHKVSLWQIAHELGISEPTMTRKLRLDLTAQDKTQIQQIIEKLTEVKD